MASVLLAASEFACSGGVCKPRSHYALAAVKDMQSQINRLAGAYKIPTIAVDGAVGPQTVTTANKLMSQSVVGMLARAVGVSISQDALQIAIKAPTLAEIFKKAADGANIPATAPPSPAAKPVVVNAAGQEVPASAVSEMAARAAHSPFMLAGIAAAVGGIVYFGAKALKKPKRGRRR